MACLPAAGRVSCTVCYNTPIHFDATSREEKGWRITANPLAWGSLRPRVLILGFSKGPTQAGALASTPHDQVAFKGARGNAYRILQRLSLVPASNDPDRAMLDMLSDANGQFAFGSLIRCTVTRWDSRAEAWLGTGGGMLDKFASTPFGSGVTSRCAQQFLKDLPAETKLVVLYGLGSRLGYVDEAERVIRSVRGTFGWQRLNDVSYGDERVTFVHTEHFRAQGALLPNWLGATSPAGTARDPSKVRLANLAYEAAQQALRQSCLAAPTRPARNAVGDPGWVSTNGSPDRGSRR